MHKFFCLVLLAAAGADRVEINSLLDSLLERLNNIVRDVGNTTTPIPEIPLDSKVIYSGASLLGLDSFRRTADCWQEVEGNVVHIDISYGIGLLAISLPHLEIAGTSMSAYARVRDNSVHFNYTMQVADEKCNVTLNFIRLEKMENVEFGASRPEYDGTNLDEFFKSVVLQKLNGIIYSNIEQIELYLQKSCNIKGSLNAGNVEEVVKSLL